MKIRSNVHGVLLFTLLLGASACIGGQAVISDAEQSGAVGNTGEQDFANIVKDLPQSYVITETHIGSSDEKTAQPADQQEVLGYVRFDYVSKDPVKETKRGGVFLKSSITRTQYLDQQSAGLAMQEKLKAAHPDMGLSYEWDYLVQSSDSIYHLHAGCVVSEQNFYNMAANLDELIARSNKGNIFSINCRCGGGCKIQGNHNKE